MSNENSLKKKQYLIYTDDKGNLNPTKLAVDELCQIGTILIWSADIAPSGWLLCNGQTYATKDYPELYKVIRNQYGGDNTNFNVPNLSGRVAVGLGTSDNTKNFGMLGGQEDVTLEVKHLPKHSHTYTDNYSASARAYTPAGYPALVGSSAIEPVGRISTGTGGGGSHLNMQPYLVLNYIIKF